MTDDGGPPVARLAMLAALVLLLASCARNGDFGRPQPGVIADTIAPAIGFVSTWSAGEPVSHFTLTDDERTLRNLGWTLVAPAHAADWIGRTAAELQRAEIVRRADLRLPPERYSRLLSGQRYRSSETRYARIMDDAVRDMAAIDPYFAFARRVREADRARLAAALALPDITPREVAAVHGRIAQNQRQFAWVKRALLFRLYAYRYALDRLMIETPSAQAPLVIARLDAMEVLVREALELDAAYAAGLDAPITAPDQPVDLLEIVAKD